MLVGDVEPQHGGAGLCAGASASDANERLHVDPIGGVGGDGIGADDLVTDDERDGGIVAVPEQAGSVESGVRPVEPGVDVVLGACGIDGDEVGRATVPRMCW